MVALTSGARGHDERRGLFELGQAPERSGVRPGKVEQFDEDFFDRPKRFGRPVDQAGVDAVASGEESVLGERLFGGAGVLGHVPLLKLEPSDELDEGDQRRGVQRHATARP